MLTRVSPTEVDHICISCGHQHTALPYVAAHAAAPAKPGQVNDITYPDEQATRAITIICENCGDIESFFTNCPATQRDAHTQLVHRMQEHLGIPYPKE